MTIDSCIATAVCDARDRAWPADVDCWLSLAELDEWNRLHHPLRRNEWLGGRWLIKCLLRRSGTEAGSKCSAQDVRQIEILSRDAMGRPIVPRMFQNGRVLPAHVSIAHADGIVWVALSTHPLLRVGIDVEPARPVAQRLQDVWFTPGECEWARTTGNERGVVALWCAKEAVYKATNRNEPFDPARYEIHPGDSGQWSWTVRGVPSHFPDAVSVSEINGVLVALATAVSRPREYDCVEFDARNNGLSKVRPLAPYGSSTLVEPSR